LLGEVALAHHTLPSLRLLLAPGLFSAIARIQLQAHYLAPTNNKTDPGFPELSQSCWADPSSSIFPSTHRFDIQHAIACPPMPYPCRAIWQFQDRRVSTQFHDYCFGPRVRDQRANREPEQDEGDWKQPADNAQEPHPAARHGALVFVMWDMSRHKSMDAPVGLFAGFGPVPERSVPCEALSSPRSAKRYVWRGSPKPVEFQVSASARVAVPGRLKGVPSLAPPSISPGHWPLLSPYKVSKSW
jgi:hypothetical protein